MQYSGLNRSRRGLSLVECLAGVAMFVMIGMAMGPSLEQMRMQQRGITSAANLQEIGAGAAMYAGGNNGRMFSYSWRAGEAYVMPDGRTKVATDDQTAAANQNTEILMRRTGRLNGQFKIRTNFSRLPHRRFNQVVLMDYLNEPLESTRYIDPADANQFIWHANPLDYNWGSSVPYANGVPDGYDQDPNWAISAMRQRWAFASSYQLVPSSWQSDYPNLRYRPIAGTPHLFQGGVGGIALSTGRYMDELLFPSHKVWMFEEFDREVAGSPYFAYDHARSAKLMFDGSVNEWASGDAYPSVVQEDGFPYSVWEQAYVPLDTFPVPLGGLGDQTLLNQRYRWTFRGLTGVDYGPGNPDG